MLCFICLKGKKNNNIAVVWLVSHVRLFVIPWTAASQGSLLFTISRSLLKLMSIESVSDAIQPSVVPFSSCLQSFPASGSFSMSWLRWPKYWSFSFSISPSNEYSGLVSFRIDWFGLLAVQGTLKSLLQHYGSSWNFILYFGNSFKCWILLILFHLPILHFLVLPTGRVFNFVLKLLCWLFSINILIWGTLLYFLMVHFFFIWIVNLAYPHS